MTVPGPAPSEQPRPDTDTDTEPSPPDPAAVAVDDDGATETSENPKGSLAKRSVRRGVLLLITLLIFNYLVLPQLAGARKALDTLSHVTWWMLIVALALALAALWSYAPLTMAALPGDRHERPVTYFTMFRIQLATKTVTNLVPGGSAAGSTLGYRLMVASGLSGTETAFALATVGLGSAVVLNVILWVSLLVSIPRSGLQPAYTTAAFVGAGAITAFAALILLLMKGQGPLDRIVRAIADKVPRMEPDSASRTLNLVVEHLRELAARPDIIRRGVFWATANWMFDAASLWVFLAAYGQEVQVDSLLVAFGLANVLAVIPITPGGLGVVEAVLTSTLVGFGVPSGPATLGVVTFRLAQFWLPIPLGALAYLSLKIWPGGTPATTRRHRLGELATEAFSSHEID
ncbi:MAG: flippase-like domain-containing protein [Actinobacteria bacterium]|nr:flippase-like domain-containing protein [Actinomycetota bacterium]